MKKILILVLPLVFGINALINAQGTATGDLFKQNPAIQASIIAATDDSIEERIDPMAGEIYYVRQVENPWNGVMTFILVEFNKNTSSFTDVEYYTLNGDDENDATAKPQKPCPVQQDSCKHKKQSLLKNKQKARPEPHRSSRVKLADNF